MVHTRNGRNYSVQPDGCGQGICKTKSRSERYSSRKTHLEDARVAPHSPRSVPTEFDVNSESELINGNISRAEPCSGGRNRNISMPVQKLVHIIQRRRVGNMPKPLAGGHELLLTHQSLSGSGEDHRALRRPEERVGNDSSFGDRGPSGVYQLQTSSRSVRGQAQETSEEEERYQEPSRQGERQSQLAQTLPKRVQDPQIGAFSHGKCIQQGQKSDGIHSQGAGKDEQNLSTQIIKPINPVKSSIDVELGKYDVEINAITSDISEFKRNDKKHTEWYQLTNVRLDSIINTCDGIESKFEFQNDEMEDLSIFNINDQLKIIKDHILEISENNNQFATHLAQSDSERQKLKDEIIANVEKIHKNYEPHMPRHSTPLIEKNFC
ncbi:hypothetical protein O181_118077 [Austropuccinia psidii MF-1]|uniref:Uncharacterized protein n=1 Tax=Austropuccinia psidii MF-1 TaxID=1389203 RepID=A0A9Q3Q015_9BASI|nr:hypothetical protein [Austropuccinia psidii MF-1]